LRDTEAQHRGGAVDRVLLRVAHQF
jgi:hypothetical protein